MGKINQLSPNVFNMIAAGEVVERPSSVVKELVENAIDAGATQIDVYVEEGGIRKIQVSDNGIGIAAEDLRTAFLPHATSKISAIYDLDSISTLGFRGEALASIASVSEIEMISAHSGTVSKITLSGGEVRSEGGASRDIGTIITVENLFFNTPARLKFLKKPTSELHYILDVMRMLTLANPQIAFSLCNEDGDLLTHEGGTLSDALYSVYDANTVKNLIPIERTSSSRITVKGFSSNVDFTKPNRTYQTIIVNGRAVSDSTIFTAVEKAYSEYLMKRSYPMFVLDIILPFDDVDVNVHPSKTEVRFRDKQAVFGAVYKAISDAIAKSRASATLGFNIDKTASSESSDIKPVRNSDTKPDLINAHNSVENNANIINNVINDYKDNGEKYKPTYAQARIDTSALMSGKTAPKPRKTSNYSYSMNDYDAQNQVRSQFKSQSEHINKNKQLRSTQAGNYMEDFAQSLHTDNQAVASDDITVFDGKIVGQIFDTYIVVERDGCVYVIDQHAAHERVLYDKILAHLSADYVQTMLIPYKLTLSGEECEYFERIMPSLCDMGFEIELSGLSVLIKAVPQPIVNMDFRKLFSELFSNMSSASDITLAQLIKDKLCQQACKAAIKGGEQLSREQIERVIKAYVDENGNLPAKCPHGRPAVIAFTQTDLEKLFKRIV